MKKILIGAGTIAFLSILAMALLGATKVLNAPHILETDGVSYSDISAYIYVFVGALLLFITFYTYKFHIVLGGLIPFLLGVSVLSYGIFLCYVKFC